MAEVGFSFVDFTDFRTKYNNLGHYLITDPMTVMTMLEHLQSLFFGKGDHQLQSAKAPSTLLSPIGTSWVPPMIATEPSKILD